MRQRPPKVMIRIRANLPPPRKPFNFQNNLFRNFLRNTAYFLSRWMLYPQNTDYFSESVINNFRLFPPKYRFFCVGGCYPRNAAYFSGWNVISPKYHSFSESVDVIPKYYLFFRVSGCYFPVDFLQIRLFFRAIPQIPIIFQSSWKFRSYHDGVRVGCSVAHCRAMFQ